MDHIQFEHECFVGGVKYEAGTTIPAAELPEEWLKGALAAKFVSRVRGSSTTSTPSEESLAG